MMKMVMRMMREDSEMMLMYMMVRNNEMRTSKVYY